jgi:branched-chain amino acid transport system permease protein
MEFILTQLINGLTFAAVLYLFSCGLSLIQGVMKIVNIAHGSFFMLGGYVALTVMRWTGDFLLGIMAGVVSIAILGLLVERIFLRKFSMQILPQLLITIGFLLIFKDVVFLIWGGDPYSLPVPAIFERPVRFGNIQFSTYRIFAVLAAAAVALGQWIFIEKTTLGAKLRAAVDDGEMAGGVGINVPLVKASMFALGAALAGFGGVMAAPFFGIYNNADIDFLPLAFVVVIIGGEGSLKGAAVASVIVGVIDTFGKALFPELSYFTIFAPMALVVAIRPAGLFGKA